MHTFILILVIFFHTSFLYLLLFLHTFILKLVTFYLYTSLYSLSFFSEVKMKNKRKYEDTVPANAENISKKNLNKLRKLTKPGNPVVKVNSCTALPTISVSGWACVYQTKAESWVLGKVMVFLGIF